MVDAALAVRERVPADMIAVRVTGPIRAAVVASPSYLEKHGAPRTPDDLSSHQCIEHRVAYNGEIWRWRFERNGKKKRVAVGGSVTVNDAEAAVRAALCGLGIAYSVAQHRRRLVP
jgi:DNA-binding transcriptional LysR family regulator